MAMNSLHSLFEAGSVAVVGASTNPEKTGHIILKNIVDGGFSGHLYPINPKPGDILDLRSYASLDEIEGEIDLAVIVIPSKGVLDVLGVCGQRGVGSVIVISASWPIPVKRETSSAFMSSLVFLSKTQSFKRRRFKK